MPVYRNDTANLVTQHGTTWQPGETRSVSFYAFGLTKLADEPLVPKIIHHQEDVSATKTITVPIGGDVVFQALAEGGSASIRFGSNPPIPVNASLGYTKVINRATCGGILVTVGSGAIVRILIEEV